MADFSTDLVTPVLYTRRRVEGRLSGPKLSLF